MPQYIVTTVEQTTTRFLVVADTKEKAMESVMGDELNQESISVESETVSIDVVSAE